MAVGRSILWLLLSVTCASAYPWKWLALPTTSCGQHPAQAYAGHLAPQEDLMIGFVVTGSKGAIVVSQVLCPGNRYTVEASWDTSQMHHALLTTSQGVWKEPSDATVSSVLCPNTAFDVPAGTSITRTLNLPCSATGSLTFKTTHSIPGMPYLFASVDYAISTACAASTCSTAPRPAGQVVAWGDNDYGLIKVPSGLSSVVGVAAGYRHSVALLSTGKVKCWGQTKYGQCNVPVGLSGVSSIAAKGDFTIALLKDGTVKAWGRNSQDGEAVVPPGINKGSNKVVKVAAGLHHSLALRRDGSVVAWGYNGDGQVSLPSAIQGKGKVIDIACGYFHSLALLKNGNVVAWGSNFYSQAQVPKGLANVVGIDGGFGHSLALLRNGSVLAWGSSSSGQVKVPAKARSNVVQIAAGGRYSLALLKTGQVVAWGGIGPVATVPKGLSKVFAIAAGDAHALAIKGQR